MNSSYKAQRATAIVKFAASIHRRLGRMRAAFDGGDRAALAREAHTLNSSGGNVEVVTLSIVEGPTKKETIARYLSLVRLVAKKLHRRLAPGVDLESPIHSGVVGLLVTRLRNVLGINSRLKDSAPAKRAAKARKESNLKLSPEWMPLMAEGDAMPKSDRFRLSVPNRKGEPAEAISWSGTT